MPTLTIDLKKFTGRAQGGRIKIEAIVADIATGKIVSLPTVVDKDNRTIWIGPEFIRLSSSTPSILNLSVPSSDDPDHSPPLFSYRVTLQLEGIHPDEY